jgi:hypothetical protein
MVIAAVCCVILLSPAQTTSLESGQDSIDSLLNKIDQLTASQKVAPASIHKAVLAHHDASQHVRLNVETPEQKFLDEVCFYFPVAPTTLV